jgi:uncharacterized protein (UPF0332 family)
MATWRDVGIDNFRAAVSLYDMRSGRAYRSCVSRFYYAVFSILTDELIRRNATTAFANNRGTPGHRQMLELIDVYFTHQTEVRRENLARYVGQLYRYRIQADYLVDRIDKAAASDAYKAAERIFRWMGVKP